LQTTVEVGAEFLVRRAAGRRERPHDQLGPGRETREALSAQVPEPALDPMAEHGVPHGPADHEADARDVGGCGRRVTVGEKVGEQEVHHDGVAAAAASTPRDAAQVDAAGEAMRRREHGREGTRTVEPGGSDRETLAALAATRGQDGAPRTGAHAQPEAVHLVAPTVVRLVRTLAHDSLRWVTAWTCGTRRHRVTEERYARARRQVKFRRREARRCAAGVDINPPA
jgi:hypothetical protein